jgi:hypothetical protein
VPQTVCQSREVMRRALALINSGNFYFVGLAHAVGFIPSSSSDFTPPSDFNEVMQFPNAVLRPAQHEMKISMSPSQLYGSSPTKWYHTTTTGTPPVADSSAGAIVYATRSAFGQAAQSTYSYVTISGVLELKAPISNGDALGLTCTTWSEERKLRIDTNSEHFDCGDQRTSVREDCINHASSVPNTPMSNSSLAVSTVRYGEGDRRSDRPFDRPRLVRQ